MNQIFLGDNYFYYRIFILLFHILCVLLLYKLVLSLNYNSSVAFISALLFSVLTSHTETLFFINCITELFSALFILSGLLMFANKKEPDTSRVLMISLLFLLALFSKENAVCYIPLIFIVNIMFVKHKWKKSVLILVIPFTVYFVVRIISGIYYPGGNLVSTIVSMDLNPLKIFYKLVHYYIMMLFPVKIIFEILGFNSLEYLISIYRKPADNIIAFVIFSAFIFAVLVTVTYFVIRILKKEIVFPVLFTVFTLLIYLFSFSTAERYSYLPSAGLCLLLGVFFSKLDYSKLFNYLLVGFVLLHLLSLMQRSYRYMQAAEFSHQSMKNLYETTDNLDNGSYIRILSLPPKKYGIYFLNVPNFYYNWNYNYPGRKLNFIFEEPYEKIDAVLNFNEEKSGFEFVK